MALLPEDQAAVRQMKVDLESLKQFETDILKVLDELTDSKATDPVQGLVQFTNYGTGFNEATAVGWGTYGVVENLKRLSTVLHKQIEAMALSIQIAQATTAEAEETNKIKLSQIFGDLGMRPKSPAADAPKPQPGVADVAGTD
ncbi:hypothetical protein [Yinghuangia seranimata]|uniref:hypothetical protein n=1 Tax=Yinghuangia seranimata TaxID=408067 RepID=UPI00248D135F|nr:hypothetical protein [Yinghuangia seranimata]MDI2128186.1 hypothetical protein [Yinghuangia seranimata]